MGNLAIIFKRELMSYFATPLAYIFIVIFLISNGILTCCRFLAFTPGCI
jgi:ABC-2 type transport system permease protein